MNNFGSTSVVGRSWSNLWRSCLTLMPCHPIMIIIDFSLSFNWIWILILLSSRSWNPMCLASYWWNLKNWVFLDSNDWNRQSWWQCKFMQLVLEPVICHYIRRPTSWASMDKINFTLHSLSPWICRIEFTLTDWDVPVIVEIVFCYSVSFFYHNHLYFIMQQLSLSPPQYIWTKSCQEKFSIACFRWVISDR